MTEFNWTDRELTYLINLTGTDCVRLKGAEPKLRKVAQKVHAKLKIMQNDRIRKWTTTTKLKQSALS